MLAPCVARALARAALTPGGGGRLGAWAGRGAIDRGRIGAATGAPFSSGAASTSAPTTTLQTRHARRPAALLAGFALGGLGAWAAWAPARAQQADDAAGPPTTATLLTNAPPWARELAAGPGVVQVLSAADLEAQAHAFLRSDHVFSALLRHDMVRDLVALYDPAARRMHYLIHLGEDVCGYPRVAHGGLTAAIVDEAMGHLFYALRTHGCLPFAGPAFTARLEVDYRHKIGAGRLLLVTAEVEAVAGRKLWMRATVTDGPPGQAGTREYAAARALFVAPRPSRLVREVVRYVVALVVPGARFD